MCVCDIDVGRMNPLKDRMAQRARRLCWGQMGLLEVSILHHHAQLWLLIQGLYGPWIITFWKRLQNIKE